MERKKSTARLYDFDVTASGDVYVAGTSGTSAQTFAARYNKAGNLIWEDVYSPDVIEQQTFSTSGGSCVGINPNHPDEVTIGGNVIVKMHRMCIPQHGWSGISAEHLKQEMHFSQLETFTFRSLPILQAIWSNSLLTTMNQ